MLLEVTPVDGVRHARQLFGVAHAEKEPTVLGSPVKAGTDVEDHRVALGRQLGTWAR